MKLVFLAKVILAIMLALFFVGCAGETFSQSNTHADGHIVQGGAVAAEGMIYFPLALPNDKK
jgi:poly(3-hydroxybutyrate) depolymerase